MENYSYNWSTIAESGRSSPRSSEIDFDNPQPWEDQSTTTNYKVKLMCSYGGKIHPRPHDNQLSYIGGDTKIVAADRSIKFSSLVAKLATVCDSDVCIRYQLPGEDLDALISVTDDDDLEHMMNEYDRLNRVTSKPARLRIFLFPVQTPSMTSANSFGSGKSDPERFVDLLNSAPFASANPVTGLRTHGNADFLFVDDKSVLSNIHQFQHLKMRIEAIHSATNYFSDANCIGHGGFGRVYLGELVHSTGKTMVAFKRLDSAVGQGDTEFWREIMILSFYKHENIVTLLGYCDDHGEKILVYEYLSNKSLDSYLASNDLTWAQRLKICIGAARGLAYLHTQTEVHLRIFHRDVKSSNILLDHNWNAKISDFGLSKFAPANNQFTFMITNPAGSFWYIDPLYKDTGLLTKESDVYSFGVVLFEVLCGRLSFCESLRPLAGIAQEYYEQNKIDELIFSNIKDEIDMSSLKLFADVAYQCLKRNREERPLMTQIVMVLEKALDIQRKFMTESFEMESLI